MVFISRDLSLLYRQAEKLGVALKQDNTYDTSNSYQGLLVLPIHDDATVVSSVKRILAFRDVLFITGLYMRVDPGDFETLYGSKWVANILRQGKILKGKKICSR